MLARFPLLGLLTALLLAVAACDSAPYTERKQLIVISESKELAMGNQAAQQIRRTGNHCFHSFARHRTMHRNLKNQLEELTSWLKFAHTTTTRLDPP